MQLKMIYCIFSKSAVTRPNLDVTIDFYVKKWVYNDVAGLSPFDRYTRAVYKHKFLSAWTAPTVNLAALRRQAHPWLLLLWAASTMAAAAVADHHTTRGL